MTRKVLAALDGEAPVGSNLQHANYLGKLIADAAGWNLDLKSVRSNGISLLNGRDSDGLRRACLRVQVKVAIGASP